MTPDDSPTASADPARLEACVRAVEAYLTRELDALLRRARKSLILRAQEASDGDEEQRLISVVEEVEALAPAAGEAFRDSVLAKLNAPGESLLDGPPGEKEGRLALVETSKVDDWLRLRKVIARHSPEARALESELRERLAEVAGVSPNPQDSPLGVPGMCVLFQAAMRGLGASREARTAIYDAFEATVVTRLGGLVAEVGRILDAPDHTLLPDPEQVPEPPPETIAGDDAAPTPDPDPSTASALDGQPESESQDVPSSPGPVEQAALQDDSLEPGRLMGVIASAARRLHEVSPGDAPQDAGALEARLAAALTPPRATLGESERRTVAAVARLLEKCLADPDLDETLRSRLWRLAPPLALMAMQDDDYLDLELQAARHDPVTGLLDDSAFRVRLEAAMSGAAQGGRTFAVCLVDVDGFRDIGQRLGQEVAGRLLRVLGGLLSRHAGAAARVARLRGDEFGVLLPASRPGTGWRFANRYLTAVNEARFALGGQQVGLGLSIGVVEPDSSLTTAEQVMRAAEAARTAAKQDGGACVRVHIPEDFG